MYIIKNAFQNVYRNKGRNLLIWLIIFIIIVTCAVSIIIKNATSAVVNDYKSRFGAEVILSMDSKKVQKIFNQGKEARPITSKQVLDFGNSDLLQSVSYDATADVNLKNINSIGDDHNKGDTTDNLPNASLKATTNPEISNDFKTGKRKIEQGEIFKKDGDCIISEQLAKLNNLKVGDIIVVRDYSYKNPIEHQLTVTGIFIDLTMAGVTKNVAPLNNKNNDIFTTFDTLINMRFFETIGRIEPTYYLKDPTTIKEFEKELQKKGLPDYYFAKADDSAYNKIVGPVEGLSDTATGFMVSVLLLGGSILLLISTMAIRERKYEIGVLRAMGMKKSKVAIGLISEMLIITTVALFIGLCVSSIVAQPVSDKLFAEQLKYAEESNKTTSISVPSIRDNDEEPLSELKVGLDSSAVIQIICTSLILSMLASLSGVIRITKYEPIKILTERN